MTKHYEIEIEQAVLGAMIIQPDCIHDLMDKFSSDLFSDEGHQAIANAIISMYRTGKHIDLLTVVKHMRDCNTIDKIGGPFYISKITDRVAGNAFIDQHIQILHEKSLTRQLFVILNQQLSRLNNGENINEILEDYEKTATKLSQQMLTEEVKSIKQLHDDFMTRNRMKIEGKTIDGIPCDLHSVDLITGGWQAPDLIVLAARPGMGKTSFVLTCARNAAVNHGKQPDIYSLEMSNTQLYDKLVAMESGESTRAIRKGLTDGKISLVNDIMGKVIESNIFIDDTPALSVPQLKRKARKRKREANTSLIIIDYLQLMKSGEKGLQREQEIAFITRSIKELAKELNTPIILLSQLSRSVEQRGGDKIPMLSDLRESGAIEQDADIVGFIYRPEYYGFMQDETGASTVGKAMLIFAKHRNGDLGEAEFRWIAHQTKFTNYETDINFKDQGTNSETVSTGIAFAGGASEFETAGKDDDQPF